MGTLNTWLLILLSFTLNACLSSPKNTRDLGSALEIPVRLPASQPLNRQAYLTTEKIYSTNLATNKDNTPPAATSNPATSTSLKPQFDWPVDDARLTRGFLPHLRKPHMGLDLAAHRGAGIFASHAGTVIYTGRDFKGYGRMIMIESSQGWATLYAHLDKIHVQEGQVVNQGEFIASMGNSGRSTGVHLHFEIRYASGPIDPLPLLPDGERIQKLITAK